MSGVKTKKQKKPRGKATNQNIEPNPSYEFKKIILTPVQERTFSPLQKKALNEVFNNVCQQLESTIKVAKDEHGLKFKPVQETDPNAIARYNGSPFPSIGLRKAFEPLLQMYSLANNKLPKNSEEILLPQITQYIKDTYDI